MGIKIDKRTVDAAMPEAARFTLWDGPLPGFGLRVEPSGRKSYVYRYRAGEGGRRAPERLLVLGRHGVLTPTQARQMAEVAAARVRLGEDPGGERAQARAALSVAELCDRYMAQEVMPLRKPGTVAQYRIHIEKHIKPALGNRTAKTLSRGDVEKWHRGLGASAPVSANRSMMVLSGAFSWGLKAHEIGGDNPCRGVTKFREEGRERYLTAEELARLAEALKEAETVGILWKPAPHKRVKHTPREEFRRVCPGPFPIAAIRLLLLTGARLREILNLRWADVDFERGLLLLPDSKTGRKPIILNAPALAILTALPRAGRFVIAGDNPEKPRADLQRPWALVAKRAGLEGVRLHDLRHTHASIGAGAGLGLPIIGRLLGHTQASTTQRYAHLDNDPLRTASDAIGRRIAAAMGEVPKDDDSGEAFPFKAKERKS